jgi:cytidine deaminase
MKSNSLKFRKLIAAAKAAQRNAHAPYSKFRVGAALLSYGLANCAERVAIGKAVSEGHRKFQAIAVVAPSAALSPCGACRQVIAEFGECVVICADSRNTRRLHIHLLSELLPHSFKL